MSRKARGASLKRRLTLLVLATSSLIWLPVNFFIEELALAQINGLWDIQLAESAHFLMALLEVGTEPHDLEQATRVLPSLALSHAQQLPTTATDRAANGYQHRRFFVYQMFNRDGSLRSASANAPLQRLGHGVAGFSDRLVNGTAWRVYAVPDPKSAFVLYVGEDRDQREQLARDLLQYLLWLTLIAIPPLFLLLWFAVSRGLVPLLRLVRTVRKRDHDEISPLTETAVPAEIEPLVEALESRFRRLERAMEHERQFTGNVAHELRTPLAALRVQAQVAQRAKHDGQRQRALDQVIAAVTQAGHLIDQLLTMSRVDYLNGSAGEEAVDLLDVARRTAARLEPLARKRSVGLRVQGENAHTRGDSACLGILFRNLIDNAIQYTPAGGEVSVRVQAVGLYNRVTVEDTGPGITGNQHDEMFGRFRRGAQTQGSGSGLGLSIVRRICELYSGSVRLENAIEGGLRCEVRLPSFVSETAGAPLAAKQHAVTPTHTRVQRFIKDRCRHRPESPRAQS